MITKKKHPKLSTFVLYYKYLRSKYYNEACEPTIVVGHFIATLSKKASGTDVFFWILQNVLEHLF